MIVLDTNVLSALMRHPPDTGVVEWLDKQPRTSIWTTSITILEIRYGLHILPIGKRRSALLQAFERVLVEKIDRKSTRLNSSHVSISYAVFCLKKKKNKNPLPDPHKPPLIPQPRPYHTHTTP